MSGSLFMFLMVQNRRQGQWNVCARLENPTARGPAIASRLRRLREEPTLAALPAGSPLQDWQRQRHRRQAGKKKRDEADHEIRQRLVGPDNAKCAVVAEVGIARLLISYGEQFTALAFPIVRSYLGRAEIDSSNGNGGMFISPREI